MLLRSTYFILGQVIFSFFVNCMQHSFGVEVTEINGFINHGKEAKVHPALLANSAH